MHDFIVGQRAYLFGKSKVDSPYGLVKWVLERPNELVNARADGILSGLAQTMGVR